ncbi:MAG: hypothetical protein GXO98_02885 [Nitrospirae bacterium]|nr:hypothetical protein [Nitrospirota bacterium]
MAKKKSAAKPKAKAKAKAKVTVKAKAKVKATRCAANTKAGKRCKRSASGRSKFCIAHKK